MVQRQHVAKQNQVESQRRANERTMRLLAHLRQQEVDRNRRWEKRKGREGWGGEGDN